MQQSSHPESNLYGLLFFTQSGYGTCETLTVPFPCLWCDNIFYSLKTQSGTEVSPIIWDGPCCPKPQSRLFQTGSTLRFFHQKMGIWHEVQVWYLRITDTELYTKMLCQSNKQNFGLILQVALGHFLVDASAVCVLARKLGLEQYQSLSWSFLVPWKSHLETYLRNFITASFNVVQINGLNSS